MSKLDEIMQGMRQFAPRLEAVEKTVAGLGEVNQAARVIQKAMTDGRGRNGEHPYALGVGNELMLLSTGSPRQKALGWGSFLTDLHLIDKRHGNIEQIEKKIEKQWGSRPVQKTPLAEGIGATGGYTVPVHFYAELLRLVAEEAFVRSLCTTIPMQSRSMLIPALTQSAVPATGTSAFFGGIIASWQPEAQTINESEPSFRQIELVARDLVFYTVASNQLLQDNAVALDTLLTTLFKEAMAWFFDYYIINGNGAGQPLGFLNAPSTISESRSSSNHVSLDDLANMVSKLLLSSHKTCCWIMHPSVMPELIQLTNGATNSPFLIWMNPAPNAEGGPIVQQMPMKLFSFPIYWTEKAPKLGSAGDVSLVDLSKQLVGDRLALQIETSSQAKFLANQMVWRIIARWDSQPWLNAPVTLADGTYQMSNAVKLAA